MKDGNKKNDTLKNTMRMIGCELVIYSIATFWGIFPCAGHWKSRWWSDEPGKCVKAACCDFWGEILNLFESEGESISK